MVVDWIWAAIGTSMTKLDVVDWIIVRLLPHDRSKCFCFWRIWRWSKFPEYIIHLCCVAAEHYCRANVNNFDLRQCGYCVNREQQNCPNGTVSNSRPARQTARRTRRRTHLRTPLLFTPKTANELQICEFTVPITCPIFCISISINIYSCIARFSCDSTAFFLYNLTQ